MVRHRALNLARTVGRDTAYDESHDRADDAPQRPAAIRHATSTDAWSTLDPQRRDSILLASLDGYSHEQVAQALSTPLGTVKSWIRRGLVSLKD